MKEIKNTANEHIVLTDPVFLPVLPLKNLVALPKSIIPIIVGRDFSIKAVDFAMTANKQVFVTAQKSIDVEKPSVDDVFTHGTRAVILQVARMTNGTLKILVEGVARSRILDVTRTDDFLGVMAQDLPTVDVDSETERTALWRNLFELFKEFVAMNDKVAPDIVHLFKGPEDLDYLADTVAVQVYLDFEERQEILEELDLKQRVVRLAGLLKNEIEILKAEQNIKKRVQSQVEKHQRDYYLNEQIRAIQRELGREDYQEELNEIRKKAKENQIPAEPINNPETGYIYVPRHEKIDKIDFARVNELTILLTSDPVVRYYGWQPGDIIKIYRDFNELALLSNKQYGYSIVKSHIT